MADMSPTITAEALIADFKRVQESVPGGTVTRKIYLLNGRYSQGDYERVFGGFGAFRMAALLSGQQPATPVGDRSRDLAILEDNLKALRSQLAMAEKEALNAEVIRREIFRLAEHDPQPPKWLVEHRISKHSPGVPTLLCSDWHWGEVVDPAQIGGVNSYNLEIAHGRARTLIENAIDLLNNHVVNPDYPGMVLCLGGDMVSGDIHEELSKTNDRPIMEVAMDLVDVLVWCISTLADEFGAVFVPCVTGNHGRNTKKMESKNRTGQSFDWLIYASLMRVFQRDQRVTFHVPSGPDAHYRIYNHRYLLTHGDQFRGGDGMIGALGPVLRGDHKKRSRNGQIGMEYDTLLMGHWHQLVQIPNRVIMNGSLIGYNEYAYQGNFGFERPQQALWITHPDHGITISMPVYAERERHTAEAEWVSVPRVQVVA